MFEGCYSTAKSVELRNKTDSQMDRVCGLILILCEASANWTIMQWPDYPMDSLSFREYQKNIEA